MQNQSNGSARETLTTWLYRAGTALLFVWFALVLVKQDTFWTTLALNIMSALFLAGAALHFSPMLRTIWKNPAGALLFTLANAVALLVASVYARKVLTAATGMPGQDFDWAVAALSLIMYIPAAISLAGIFLGIGAVYAQALLITNLAILRPTRREAWRWACHAFGFFAGFYFTFAFDQMYDRHRQTLEPLALALAYHGDYQEVRAHPCLKPGTRVKLHGDNVVSIITGTKVLQVTVLMLRDENCRPSSIRQASYPISETMASAEKATTTVEAP